VLRRKIKISTLAASVFSGVFSGFLFLGPWPAISAESELKGECRVTLRPLLLQQNPDAAQLRSVRELCQREADAGDPEAIYQLSFFFLGLNSWDPGKATSLILTAAERDIPEAQYWLAWQYDSGPLLPNDPALALQWYQASAENDHRLALERLADAYTEGDFGLRVDKKMASQFRARAERCAEESG
jgi:TPR repeat protein